MCDSSPHFWILPYGPPNYSLILLFFVSKYVPPDILMATKGKLWSEEDNVMKSLVWHLSQLLSVIFKLPTSAPSFLPPLCTARRTPSPRVSMKVRRRLLIIANYRNIGRSWWDQLVALQAGLEAKAKRERVTAKNDFKHCHDRYINIYFPQWM